MEEGVVYGEIVAVVKAAQVVCEAVLNERLPVPTFVFSGCFELRWCGLRTYCWNMRAFSDMNVRRLDRARVTRSRDSRLRMRPASCFPENTPSHQKMLAA